MTHPRFVAGAVVRGDRIVQAAPILGWSVGKPLGQLARWVLRQGGAVEVLVREEHEGDAATDV